MAAAICFNLANSIWFMEHKDKDVLLDLEWINENLNTTGEPLVQNLTSNFVAQLKLLRNYVIQLFEKGSLDDQLNDLNLFLKNDISFPQLVETNEGLTVVKTSLASVEERILSNIVLAMIQLVNDQSMSRIHRCDNADCQFYFMDMSKNQSKKYCSIKCNNVAKVRRYRAKL